MNQGTASVIEDEVVIFQANQDESKELKNAENLQNVVETRVIIKTVAKERFARLKKSLRKKSSDIL